MQRQAGAATSRPTGKRAAMPFARLPGAHLHANGAANFERRTAGVAPLLLRLCPFLPAVASAMVQSRENDVATDDTNTASVAGRYASALFELAREQRQLDTVEKDLTSFAGMLDASPDLQRLVRSPVFSSDEQAKAITAILAKAGIGGLAANFLKLLAKNRRLFAVGDMIRSYRAIAARERGEVSAEVTSAHALTAEQLSALTDTLKAASQGKAINIQAKVDPSILGGLIVKMGSRMVDNSLKTKLSTLKVAMKGTG